MDLGGNQLTSVPAALEALTALTWLDLRGNKLESVPKKLEWGLAGNAWRPNPTIDNITNNLRNDKLHGYMLDSM